MSYLDNAGNKPSDNTERPNKPKLENGHERNVVGERSRSFRTVLFL